MSIEKALAQAPESLPEFEVETDVAVDLAPTDAPEIVVLEDGSVEITLVPGADAPAEIPFDANLAEHVDERNLATLVSDLIQDVETDRESRREWADAYTDGIEVLGFKYEMRTDPWQDACGVFSTLLAEAVIRFQAEAMSETFPAAGPVKTRILGIETPDKVEAADRVRTDMNYELTEVMTEYRPEHERLLYNLALAGSAFKKVYYDATLGRQTAIFVPAEDMLVPYGASHIETAERVTHVMRKTKNEMEYLMSSGFYRDQELGEPVTFQTDIEKKKAEESGYSITKDDRYAVYEIHVDMVLPGFESDNDKLAAPYVVTIEKGNNTLLAIRRNWDPQDPQKRKRQHFVHYVYVPGFGFYGLGLIHIIGGYARAGTSLIRQLVDAGTLSNLPGGLKTRGMRVKGDDTPIAPGEFRDVDVPSGTIKDNIMTLPYKEPSQTLLRLLEIITEEGRRLGAISDMKISDMSAQAPVGTTLAILERTLKPMAAVQARVHYAMKQEFKLLKAIMAEYAKEEYGYIPNEGEPKARRGDYNMVEVIPVSDPNSTTMAQRVTQYQAVYQMAQSAPQIYDQRYLHRQMIEVLGVKNADKIIPMPDDAKPVDPVSENMGALKGQPMQAFIYQDHEAHLASHTSFIQDPQIAQFIGQTPQGQQISGALQAHIAEHIGFLYRKQIEDTLGVPLPPPGEELPEEIELQLSRVVADAGRQLTGIHQQQAAAQQAAEQAQDPQFQLQMAEVDVKKADVKRKAKKDVADVMLEREKLRLEQQKISQQAKQQQDNHGLASRKAKSDFGLKIAQASKPTPPPKGAK